MTKISYKYWGNSCNPRPPHSCGVACLNWPRFWPETIIEERSMDRYNTVVSSFDPQCETGSRKEANGIGGWRWFYFGLHEGIYSWGYELTSETDFYQTGTQNPIRRRQDGPEPTTAWDGRGILTQMAWVDDSGSPSQIHHPSDGSNSFFDWVNPGNSATPDPARIHNQRHHWLFKKTDELNNVTVYRRDERRRVTDISYYNASNILVASEGYTYNEWNQVTTHTLPSGAVQHYEYDGFHRLEREYNSIDIANPSDYKFYTYYGPGNHPEWTDLVEMVVDGRARVSGAPFTVRMTYNGRQQVMSEEHASTTGQYPTVRYEYDTYGNRTAVIDELGHRKDYLYDDYRRQITCTEQVNGPGPNGTNVTSRRTDWIYDRVIDNFVGAGNPFRATAHTSKDWRIQIEPAFNAAGDRRATARTFDFNNRITSEQTGLVQWPTEDLGTLHTVDGVTETHFVTYDENGQKQTSTDPLGRITTYGYNNRNRLETTTEPKRASQPTNPVTRFDYDVAGNKLKVTFPDMKTQRWENYDPFGQPWQFFDERNNPTDLIYCWGPMKKLYKVTTHREMDAGGVENQPTTFSYDLMGRPTQTLFPDGTNEFSTYEFGQLSTWKTRRNQSKQRTPLRRAGA